METFFALLALCAGNSPVTVNSPHKGQWRGTLMYSLICAWTNGWINNRDAGDLRRYRAHCDVTIMFFNNTPRSEQNGWHCANYIFECVLLINVFNVLVQMILSFVAMGQNKVVVSQVLVWPWTDSNPFSHPIMTQIRVVIEADWRMHASAS